VTLDGIRTRAIVLAGLSILPMLGLVAFQAHQQQAQEVRETAQRARVLAHLVAAQQSEIVAQARQLMAGLAVSMPAAGAELLGARCASRLSALLDAFPIYHQVFFALPDGEVRCAAHPLRKPVNIGDRAYFRRALATRDFTLSGVIFGRDSRVYTVAAAQPLLDPAGRPLGVLVASVDLQWIGATLESAGLPEKAVISLVDATGTTLARFPGSGSHVGRKVADFEFFQSAIAHDGAEPVEFSDGDGLERYVSYAKVPSRAGDLYLRVAIPSWVVDQTAERSLRQGLALIAGVLALTLMLAWLAAERLVARPIARLSDATERLGRGDLSARTGVPHGRGEIGRLAAKFDQLAEHLQRTQRALRTLSAGNRTLLREKDEAALLMQMCRATVEVGQYPLAFVCLAREDEAKSVDVVARHGADGGLLDSLAVTWADTERGRGSVGRAIRSGQPSFVRHIATDPGAAPWRAEILERGFASVVSLPLKVEGRVIGTFTLFALEPDAFDAGEVELLEEMAADLSFGIEAIRVRARQLAAERAIERALTHDTITDLPNRGAFVMRVDQVLVEAQRADEPSAVLVAHLPHLQALYEALGYDPGNAALREVANRLRKTIGDEARIAHLQLDEFGIVLPGGGDADAKTAADDIGRLLTAPVDLGEAKVEMQASIGASFYPGHGKEAELLVRRAAIAARDAARRDLIYLAYRGATERENPARLALVGELRRAIEKRAMSLHFQSKHGLRADEVVGAEALLRWQHPERGMVPPGEFVPVAEETGLIRPMTYLVVELAVRQVRAWLDAGISLPVAVNLSSRNLFDPALRARIEGLLNTWGVPGRLLEFEITESALIEDPEGARIALRGLAELGGRLYIDDFGIGYSSLNYLVTLPVHALKIDRSFVARMTRNPQARLVVQSVVSMAHGLGLRVVAEGVETEEDAAILRELACDEAQGYLYGRPLPAQEFATGIGDR
jgi:diguanylate cyclase (GGDEF)-like protein